MSPKTSEKEEKDRKPCLISFGLEAKQASVTPQSGLASVQVVAVSGVRQSTQLASAPRPCPDLLSSVFCSEELV